MTANQRPTYIGWLPGRLISAVATEILYLLLVYTGVCEWSWYRLILLPCVGAMVVYDVSRDAVGVYKALRSGRWIRVSFWAALGAFMGVIMGLLARHATPEQFAATLPDKPVLKWALFIVVGMAFGLMDSSDKFRQVESTKT